MQMEVAGGTATWKVLIMKKWGVMKYGKEWVLQLQGDWNGTDLYYYYCLEKNDYLKYLCNTLAVDTKNGMLFDVMMQYKNNLLSHSFAYIVKDVNFKLHA